MWTFNDDKEHQHGLVRQLQINGIFMINLNVSKRPVMNYSGNYLQIIMKTGAIIYCIPKSNVTMGRIGVIQIFRFL